MGENLLTKVWTLDFGAHRWDADGSGANDPDRLAKFSTPNVKYIALAIARRCLMNGACWASQKTISDDTGVSKQTIARCMAELESAGWLKRVGRSRVDGGKSTDKVWMTLPEVILSAEIVPPRPQRFLPGGDDGSDHDEPPTTTTEGGPPSPRRQAPINESAHEVRPEVRGTNLENAPAARAKDDLQDSVSIAVDQIWAKASKTGRERSSKADIGAGLKAAIGRGHGLEIILRGLGGYFASQDATKDEGAFQRGAHVLLAKDRFLSFVEEQPAATSPATSDLGTSDAPGVRLQRVWMDLFRQGMAWPPERGPQPGRLGCRVIDAIQREFGVEPFRPIIEDSFLPDESGAFD